MAGKFVLEPSGGQGAIVKELIEAGASGVTSVEIDPEAFMELQGTMAPKGVELSFYNEDFLQSKFRPGDFDRVVMNPPFTNNQDVKHVAHALTFLREGGILVAIMWPNTHRRQFTELVASYRHTIEEVPAGTFDHTDTPTLILTIYK